MYENILSKVKTASKVNEKNLKIFFLTNFYKNDKLTCLTVSDTAKLRIDFELSTSLSPLAA